MPYRIPSWTFVSVAGSAAAGAALDKKRRSSWIVSGGLSLVGMLAWNLYAEAKTIETVVAQGYIYGVPPAGTEDAEPMAGRAPHLLPCGHKPPAYL